MLAAAFMFVLVPVSIIGAFLFGAWREGRNSPYGFGIGRVISNSFSAIGGAPAALLMASLLINAPISLVPQMLANGQENPWYWLAAIGVAWLLIYPYVMLFMTALAIDALAGRTADFANAARVARQRYLRGIALFVLVGIGLIAGFLLFLIPGLVLFLTWFVVWPVLANEEQGVFDSFVRSGQLMNGMRWRLLLLVVIAAILYGLFGGMGGALSLALGGEDGSPIAMAIDTVTGTLTGLIQTTAAAAVYHEARTAKEGMGSHDLEAVFA